jgi:hypothetical protein
VGIQKLANSMPSFLGVIGTCGETILVVIVAKLIDETVGGPAATAKGNSITFITRHQLVAFTVAMLTFCSNRFR